MLHNCTTFAITKEQRNQHLKETNFKLCLTQQLLNMFKLWCEWGLTLQEPKALIIYVFKLKVTGLELLRPVFLFKII